MGITKRRTEENGEKLFLSRSHQIMRKQDSSVGTFIPFFKTLNRDFEEIRRDEEKIEEGTKKR